MQEYLSWEELDEHHRLREVLGFDTRVIMAGETFEARMERACKDLEIPGAILVASDKDGIRDVFFHFENNFGFSYMEQVPDISFLAML